MEGGREGGREEGGREEGGKGRRDREAAHNRMPRVSCRRLPSTVAVLQLLGTRCVCMRTRVNGGQTTQPTPQTHGGNRLRA